MQKIDFKKELVINETKKDLTLMIEFLFKVSLLILGLIVIRFGIIQIRKYKKGEIRSKNNIFSQISFLIFFAAIIGLVIYSILGLLE